MIELLELLAKHTFEKKFSKNDGILLEILIHLRDTTNVNLINIFCTSIINFIISSRNDEDISILYKTLRQIKYTTYTNNLNEIKEDIINSIIILNNLHLTQITS